MRILRRITLLAAFVGLILWPAAAGSAVRTAQITVGTSPTLIWTAPSGSGKVLVRNPSATVSVFVGSNTVTLANGFEIAPGTALGIVLVNKATLYGIVATSTQVVQTIQGDNTQ